MLPLIVNVQLWLFVILLASSLVLGLILGAGGVFVISRRWRTSSTRVGRDVDDLYFDISVISHQLQQVGEAVGGHINPFKEEELPVERDRWAVAYRTIRRAASEVSDLNKDLNVFVRLGMSGQRLVIEPVNVPDLLETVMDDLKPAADAKNIDLGGVEVERDEGGGIPSLSGDRAVVRQIFSNLIQNAIKYNGAGTEITADVRTVGRRVEVVVSDTGRGIAPELLSTVFNRGNRRHVRGRIDGTGMGMYICKRLVELYGGTISVESNPANGTTFIISLPLRRTQ